MVPNSSEIRARARQSLKDNWGVAIGGLVLFMLACFALAIVAMIPIVGWIVEILVLGSLVLGIHSFYLGIARFERPSVAEVFSGFSRFVPAFVLYLLTTIFTFLWMLLLIIPGIIAAFRYSQAYYILRDNPEIGGLEAIRRSKRMMVGHKGRLFVLILSFIGWYLLCWLTLGIGFLWLYPYFNTAMAHFYEDLKSRMEVPPPPEIPGLAAQA